MSRQVNINLSDDFPARTGGNFATLVAKMLDPLPRVTPQEKGFPLRALG